MTSKKALARISDSEMNFAGDQHKVSEVLGNLMQKNRLSDADLGNAIGVSAATIQKLRNEKDSNPTFLTLNALANYFGLSIGQILGLEEVSEAEKGIFIPFQSHTKLFPLIELNEVIEWPGLKKQLRPGDSIRKWVNGSPSLSDNSFAILVKGTTLVSPKFPEGGILIFDPDKLEKDRDYVILLPEGKNMPIVRQILIDGEDIYFKALNPEINQHTQTIIYDRYKILAVLQQIQINLCDIVK